MSDAGRRAGSLASGDSSLVSLNGHAKVVSL